MTQYSRNRNNYKENNEYYTPKWIFDSLGAEFDLDVAAPKNGVEWLPTKKHYHQEIDGLAQKWEGFVWCNPPYSKPTPWIDKFIDHRHGIMFTQVSKSRAFIKLWNEADAIVFAPSNIMFEHKDYGRKGIFMPVALFGMGEKAKMHLQQSKINRVR